MLSLFSFYCDFYYYFLKNKSKNPVLLMGLWLVFSFSCYKGISFFWISVGTTGKHYHHLVKDLKLNLAFTKKKPEVEIMKEYFATRIFMNMKVGCPQDYWWLLASL